MPRPRTISDQDLLDGILALMRRVGPGGITFAAVAATTGLAGATLVQRFGSKQKLVRAALFRAWDLLDAETARCDATAPTTRRGAVSMLAALSADYGDGDGFADGLLILREDMRDPMLRRRGVAWNKRLTAALGRRLADRSGSRPDLGRLMAAQWQGAVLWWGFDRRGTLAGAVTKSLNAWCAAIRPIG